MSAAAPGRSDLRVHVRGTRAGGLRLRLHPQWPQVWFSARTSAVTLARQLEDGAQLGVDLNFSVSDAQARTRSLLLQSAAGQGRGHLWAELSAPHGTALSPTDFTCMLDPAQVQALTVALREAADTAQEAAGLELELRMLAARILSAAASSGTTTPVEPPRPAGKRRVRRGALTRARLVAWGGLTALMTPPYGLEDGGAVHAWMRLEGGEWTPLQTDHPNFMRAMRRDLWAAEAEIQQALAQPSAFCSVACGLQLAGELPAESALRSRVARLGELTTRLAPNAPERRRA